MCSCLTGVSDEEGGLQSEAVVLVSRGEANWPHLMLFSLRRVLDPLPPMRPVRAARALPPSRLAWLGRSSRKSVGAPPTSQVMRHASHMSGPTNAQMRETSDLPHRADRADSREDSICIARRDGPQRRRMHQI